MWWRDFLLPSNRRVSFPSQKQAKTWGFSFTIIHFAFVKAVLERYVYPAAVRQGDAWGDVLKPAMNKDPSFCQRHSVSHAGFAPFFVSQALPPPGSDLGGHHYTLLIQSDDSRQPIYMEVSPHRVSCGICSDAIAHSSWWICLIKPHSLHLLHKFSSFK